MSEPTASATGSANERVGRYQLLAPIGSGPTGAVWRAKVFGVAGFERQFAVKRILPEVTATPAAAQALSAAARAYGSLEHPRIARMTEFGVAQGQTFTAVELVGGIDAMRLMAEARLAGAALPAGGVLGLVSQVARAIGYAHGRGISHLGLAPTNVIVTPDGDVKVTDFALLAATLPQRPAELPRIAQRVAYLAPEQLAAEATSAATDVFALGVLAYELVTGQRTFRGDTPAQVAQAIMSGPPPEPALPRPIVRVLQRCLARSPFERFPDARAFADALDAALRVAPVPGTRKDIGAHVKTTLERLAELNDSQLSGVLALNLGTGPLPKLEPQEIGGLGRMSREIAEPETSQYVRPDLEVPGPAPLVSPQPTGLDPLTAAQPALARPMATMPGIAPPPIPAPRSIPAIPPFKRTGTEPDAPSADAAAPLARVGERIANDVAAVPSIGARAAIPVIPPPIPPRARASSAPPLAREATSLAADLAALGDEVGDAFDHELLGGPSADDGGDATAPRPRTILDVRTEPGIGIRPTTPHLPPPPLPTGPPPSRDTPTGELSPLLADRLGEASTKPTSEIAPLVADAYRQDALAEFPDEVHSAGYGGAQVAAAPALSRVLAAPATPPKGLPPVSMFSPPPPLTPPPLAPLRLPSEPGDARVRPRRWPWLVGGVLALGALGAVSYIALQRFAADDDSAAAAPADAAVVAKAAPADAARAVAPPPPDAAKAPPPPDAAAAAAPPVDAKVAPPPDAASAPPPPDAAAVVVAAPPDAAVAAPPPTPVPTAPSDALAISSTPPGAHLYVDGADQGVTPQQLPGTKTRHTAVLLLTGYDLYVAEIDGHGAFAIGLKAAPPTVGPAGIKVLKCAKDRYYVYVDGKPTGQICPTERINCDVGPHTVEVYDALTNKRRKWDIQVTDTRLSFRVRVE